MTEQRYTADIAYKRADLFLSSISEYSRTRIQTWIENGLVTQNGTVCKAKDSVSVGDEFIINMPDSKHIDVSPEPITLDIIYEDEDVCVINKPRGMVVHPAPGNESGTLVNALLYRFGELSDIGGEFRPGIVHRIDKMTSGLLVVAKNNMAHESLSEQFSTHTANRKYIALVCGNFPEGTGTVDAPIGRHPIDRKKMAVVENGRNAITHYTLLENIKSYALISCSLETGRTHQIRVHMAYLRHPLVGDQLYCSSPDVFHLEGQALHGYKLCFKHPRTKEEMTFSAPLPDCFSEVLYKIGWRENLPSDYPF